MKFWWKFSVASFPTEILHKVPNSYGNDVGIFCIGLVALFFFWRVVGYFKGELQNKRKLLLMDVFCKCGISLEMVTRIQDLLAVLRSPRWTYGISEPPQWLGILKPRNVEIKCHLYRNITPLKTNMSSKKVPFQKESNLFFRGCFSFRGSQEIQITTTKHQFEALVELFHHRPYKHDISKLYTSDYSPWQGINTPNQKVVFQPWFFSQVNFWGNRIRKVWKRKQRLEQVLRGHTSTIAKASKHSYIHHIHHMYVTKERTYLNKIIKSQKLYI